MMITMIMAAPVVVVDVGVVGVVVVVFEVV